MKHKQGSHFVRKKKTINRRQKDQAKWETARSDRPYGFNNEQKYPLNNINQVFIKITNEE